MTEPPKLSINVIEQTVTPVERLRRIVARIDLSSFGIPIRLEVEDSPTRIVYAGAGLPYEGCVNLLVKMVVKNRPFEAHPVAEERFSIIFNKTVNYYELSRMSDQEIAMLVRERVILAVVHEIDEHLLFDNRRLFEPHPTGPNSFVEGPLPEGVWRGRRISTP